MRPLFLIIVALAMGCADVPMVSVAPTPMARPTRRVLLKSSVGSFDLVHECVPPLRLLSGRYTIEAPPQTAGAPLPPVLVSVDGSAPEALDADAPLILNLPPGVVARVDMIFHAGTGARARCELRAEPLRILLRGGGQEMEPGQRVSPGAYVVGVQNGAGCKQLHLSAGGRTTDTRQLTVNVGQEAAELAAEAVCDGDKTKVKWPVVRPAATEEVKVAPVKVTGRAASAHDAPERSPTKAPRTQSVERPGVAPPSPPPPPPPPAPAPPPPPAAPVVVAVNDINQVGAIYRKQVDWELSCLKECYVRIDDQDVIIGAGYSEQKIVVRANQRVEIKEVR